MAWTEIPGKIDVGTYTGNGADNRNIPGVGFQPDFVMVQTNGGLPTVAHSTAMGALNRHLALLQRDRQPDQPDSSAPARRFPGRLGPGVERKWQHLTYAAWGRPAPTAVRMASMSARRTETGVVLEWRTGYEVDNLGFHVYRGPENGRVRLTTSLLAGSGLQQSPGIADRHQPLVPLERRDRWRECPRRRVLGGRDRPHRRAHVARPGQTGDARGQRSSRCR